MMQVVLSALVSAQGYCERDQCFMAEVNGTPFQFRSYWPVSTQLLRQQGSMDGRMPERKVISIMFNGNSYVDSATGRQINESVQLEINYENEKLGEPSVYTVSMQYETGVYSIIKGSGSLVVTSFKWEPDMRSFRISADVNCSVHKWGDFSDDSNQRHLKVHLENALVSVPGWLLSKN